MVDTALKTPGVSGAELLIVDDEREVRLAYRRLFEDEGYAVRLARDGVEALRLFDERHPDLILLDVMMPRMNGIVTCREIRARDPLVPVLFFTALPSEVTLVRGLGCGADDYIEKACSPAVFLARVAAALRRRQAQADERRAGEIIRLGALTADLGSMRIVEGARAVAVLKRSEGIVLRALAAKRGRYVSSRDLRAAWQAAGLAGDERQVYNLLSSLRAKLGKAKDLLETSYGNGYRLL